MEKEWGMKVDHCPQPLNPVCTSGLHCFAFLLISAPLPFSLSSRCPKANKLAPPMCEKLMLQRNSLLMSSSAAVITRVRKVHPTLMMDAAEIIS